MGHVGHTVRWVMGQVLSGSWVMGHMGRGSHGSLVTWVMGQVLSGSLVISSDPLPRVAYVIY